MVVRVVSFVCQRGRKICQRGEQKWRIRGRKGMKSVKVREKEKERERKREKEREARRINVYAFATCVCMSACMRKRIVPGALDNINFSRTRGNSL